MAIALQTPRQSQLDRPVSGAKLALVGGTAESQAHLARQALATELMDGFRRTGDRELFDALVAAANDVLLARVRMRLRSLHIGVDPAEVLQDVWVNIYRYPARFQANRPNAFAAWSGVIADNAVRRHLRRRRTDPVPCSDRLDEQQDERPDTPALVVEQDEERANLTQAWSLFLCGYLDAFLSLSARERQVLHLVEVHGMRYAEVAAALAVKADAIKMVVFRARRRIALRMRELLR